MAAVPQIDLLSVGILHEAVLAVSTEESLDGFWASVATNARWLVPATRMCVLRTRADDACEVVARVEQGRLLPALQGDVPRGDDVVRQVLEAGQPCWLDDPWRALASSDPLRSWLRVEAPRVVHVAPLVTREGPLGALLFDMDLAPQGAEQARVTALSTLYARHVGSAYTVVQTSEELRRRNWELRATQEQLVQSAKMAAVGELAGGIAHDFNNQLSGVMGFAELALQRLEPSHPVRDDLQQVFRAGEKAAGITRQLLAFGRKQRLEPRVVDIAEVLGDAERMLGRLLGEHIQLEFVRGRGTHCASVDPGQLEQAILNLAINGRDAMPDGGTLTFTTDVEEIDAEYAATHADVVPGPHATLTVSDTGTGMDADTLGKAFDPFFTTKPVGQGTGLGLSMVYGFVNQSGGHVQVSSTPGTGTKFRLYFPAVDASERRDAPSGIVETTPGGSETILVVDDEAIVADLAASALRAAGYHVMTATNPAGALVRCEQYDGTIDVLLADVVMPGMNGVSLAEQVSQRHPDMRVILMSGYAADSLSRAGAREHATWFLPKPLLPSTLCRRVREALDEVRDSPSERGEPAASERAPNHT